MLTLSTARLRSASWRWHQVPWMYATYIGRVGANGLSAKFSRQRRLISILTLFRPRRRVRVLPAPLSLPPAAAAAVMAASFSRVRSRCNYAMRSKNTSAENVSGTAGITFQGCCVRSKGSACSREPLTRAPPLPPPHPAPLPLPAHLSTAATTVSPLETALFDRTRFSRIISGLTFPTSSRINVVTLTISVLHARNDKQTSSHDPGDVFRWREGEGICIEGPGVSKIFLTRYSVKDQIGVDAKGE